MPRILNEPVSESPLWLEVAGYPRYVNEKIRREAWPVLKKLVELDCAANEQPACFGVSVGQLAERSGVPVDATQRVIQGLRKEKMLRCFLPESEEEEALFEFVTPFHPPMDVEKVRHLMAQMALQKAEKLRYIDTWAGRGDVADSLVQQAVDAYLDTFGTRINAFVLDELALIAARFRPEWIHDAFQRTVQTEKPSLRNAVRLLVDRKRRENI